MAEKRRRGRPAKEIPAKLREAVIELHAQEHGKNEVERLLKSDGLTRGMLEKIAKEEGLSWDKTRTAQAVESNKTLSKARRALLAERYLNKANELLDQLDQPYEMVEFSQRNSEFHTFMRSRPPAFETDKIVSASTRAMKEHRDIVAMDQGDENTEAKSLLSSLQGALDAYAKTDKPEDDTSTEDDADE